jgi:16S rRNA (cytidine1402-2'-O)-methyltransferase
MPLILVPTPIGNLEDITLRGLRALREADRVACEDTRRTLRLLNAYEIRKPLISCHEHNERGRIEGLLARLREGERIALVSDAGTPGISDPGALLVAAAIREGIPVEALPGANALLPALLLSGLSPERFLFAGFLKGRTSQKRARLRDLSPRPETLIFYVSPHRVLSELELFAAELGEDRPAALVREISKVHEEAIRGDLAEIRRRIEASAPRGELVLVVAGREPSGKERGERGGGIDARATRPGDGFPAGPSEEGISPEEPGSAAEEDGEGAEAADAWWPRARALRGGGGAIPEVAKAIEERYGIPKNRVKRRLLDAERRGGPQA